MPAIAADSGEIAAETGDLGIVWVTNSNIYSEKIEKYSKNLLTFAYKCGIIPSMKRVEAECADIRLG